MKLGISQLSPIFCRKNILKIRICRNFTSYSLWIAMPDRSCNLEDKSTGPRRITTLAVAYFWKTLTRAGGKFSQTILVARNWKLAAPRI